MQRTMAVALAIAAAVVLAACGATGASVGGTAPAAPRPADSTTASTTASTSVHPPFRWHASRVTRTQLGKSWHSGCPVGPSELRTIHLTYWGFDRTAHQGVLVVRSTVVSAVVSAFRSMYHHRFPIRRMHSIARYDGSDNRSMRHDNTSAFNCRYAVSDGPKSWSMHAYGEAVDIDPVENPYTLNGKVYPPKGAPYTDRSNHRRGMITPGSKPVQAFSAVGWGWGGNWSGSPDYQHFSSNGR